MAAAVGGITITAQAVDSKGNVVTTGGTPTFGFNWTDETWANPYKIAEGTEPLADDQVVIDRGLARNQSERRPEASGAQRRGQRTVHGQRHRHLRHARQRGRVDRHHVHHADRSTSRGSGGTAPNTFDDITVQARQGVSQTTLKAELTAAVAKDSSIEVLTGAEAAKDSQDSVKVFLKFFTIVLLVFAGVSVVVGMFVIYNTFGILVAQRTRETALLRALGASAAQILRSVVVESLVIGLIGSLLGVGFGVVLAVLLKLVFSAAGVDLPAGGIAITIWAIVVPIVVGVITTLVSAFVPAYRSSRVPPLAAIQDVAIDRSGHSMTRTITGGILLALGVLALDRWAGRRRRRAGRCGLPRGDTGRRGDRSGFRRPFTRGIGAPLPAIRGMTGTLARENASRNPKRTSATAMALTIGVAIVAFIIVMATSIKASVGGAVDKQFAADYVVQAKGFGPGFSPELNQKLKQLPEVQADQRAALQSSEDRRFGAPGGGRRAGHHHVGVQLRTSQR